MEYSPTKNFDYQGSLASITFSINRNCGWK